MSDPRGTLIFDLIRFAEVIRPAAIMIEQVPTFLRTVTGDGRSLVELLRMEFKRPEYDMHCDVIDASRHGVEQRRRRAVIVCVLRGHTFEFPFAISSSNPTVGSVL